MYEYYQGLTFQRYNVVTGLRELATIPIYDNEIDWVPLWADQHTRPWNSMWLSRDEFLRRWARTLAYMRKGTLSE